MKYFVFFKGEYGSGAGLESFDTRFQAEQFIMTRISENHSRTIDDYTVIYGTTQKVTALQYATAIEIK